MGYVLGALRRGCNSFKTKGSCVVVLLVVVVVLLVVVVVVVVVVLNVVAVGGCVVDRTR